MSQIVNAAIVQCGSVLFDTPATLERLEHYAGQAPDAELIVFPEAFVGGYPKGHDFGARVGRVRRRAATGSPAILMPRLMCPARSAHVSERRPRRLAPGWSPG